MLLLDDSDELPVSPTEGETELVNSLGPTGLAAIDAAIVGATRSRWMKVAMVVHVAIESGGFEIDDASVDLHTRRVIALVDAGHLEAQGNLRRARFSEVRLPGG
jgi:Protein of unknown function